MKDAKLALRIGYFPFIKKYEVSIYKMTCSKQLKGIQGGIIIVFILLALTLWNHQLPYIFLLLYPKVISCWKHAKNKLFSARKWYFLFACSDMNSVYRLYPFRCVTLSANIKYLWNIVVFILELFRNLSLFSYTVQWKWFLFNFNKRLLKIFL